MNLATEFHGIHWISLTAWIYCIVKIMYCVLLKNIIFWNSYLVINNLFFKDITQSDTQALSPPVLFHSSGFKTCCYLTGIVTKEAIEINAKCLNCLFSGHLLHSLHATL